MKNIFVTFVFILSFYTSFSQDSKIVFFRDETGSYSHVAGKIRILKDGKKIHKISRRKVYIFKSDQPNSFYSLKGSFGIFKSPGITLSAENHSIIFLAVSFKPGLPEATLVINRISLAEFKNEYNRKKWLRKRLANAGYKSLDELVDGY